MNAISALIRASKGRVKREVSVDHLDGRKHRSKDKIKRDAIEWISKYRGMLSSRAIGIGEEEKVAIRLVVVDRLVDHYELTFDDALRVTGLVNDDWLEFSKYYPQGYAHYIRELLKFPILVERDEDPIDD
ncbi:hypothetical protein [Vibrio sp. CUB2]|uniref:hypothetical protein n=1 Tax=Vibrio sp. CUB2 TaxID=2315233 RepID=UPI00076AC1F9|nr:hypothetical protein [Vibrio sp. CUB2]